MKFMMFVKGNDISEAGCMPSEELIGDMGKFNEKMMGAGVLLDAGGLQPTSKGTRIIFRKGQHTIVDGPFAETKELIAGYWLIQVKSGEEALQWLKQVPAPFGKDADGVVELRQLYDMEDFEPSEAMEREKELVKRLASTK